MAVQKRVVVTIVLLWVASLFVVFHVSSKGGVQTTATDAGLAITTPTITSSSHQVPKQALSDEQMAQIASGSVEGVNLFLDDLRSKGGDVNVEVTADSKHKWPLEEPVRGAVVTKDLHRDDIVVGLPVNLVITAAVAMRSPIAHILHSAGNLGVDEFPEDAAVAYYMWWLTTREGMRDPVFGAYGALLVSTSVLTPQMMDPKERSAFLQETKLSRPVMKHLIKEKLSYFNANIATLLPTICPTTAKACEGICQGLVCEGGREFLPPCKTCAACKEKANTKGGEGLKFSAKVCSLSRDEQHKELHRAYNLYSSRHWQIPWPNSDGQMVKQVLVNPGADLLNMGPPDTTFVDHSKAVDHGNGGFRMYANTPLKKGDEAEFYYGDECKEALMVEYGFFTEHARPCTMADFGSERR